MPSASTVAAAAVVILAASPAAAWCADGTAGYPLTLRDAAGNVTCLPGFYCPNLDPANSTTWPVSCLVDNQCSIDRIFGQTCEDRVEPFEPRICKEGNYCPTPDQQLECPSGKFCTTGTVEPKSCPLLSLCPKGTKKPRYFGGILFMAAALIAAVVIFVMYNRKWRFRGQTTAEVEPKEAEPLQSPPPEEMVELPASDKDLEEAIARLDKGFERARGDRRPMRIDADELRVVLPDGKVLLHGVSGSLRPGKVTAIMGPSGAGKTVFMTTVLGRIDPAWKVEGELRVNGQQIRLGGIRSQIGFVPQDDVLHTELTVDANLFYSSEMRLPRDWSLEERREMREAVLDALRLAPLRCTTVGDARTRGISASQRKRVSTGVEMASAPLVLFLDEPTSGLDATTSLDLVRVLKQSATQSELTVAMVVHQPRVEIWNELDELLLLAPGGRTVYLGPQRNVVDYFSAHGTIFGPQDNPADVVMDTIAARGEELVDLWKKQLAGGSPLPAPQEKPAVAAPAVSLPASPRAAGGGLVRGSDFDSFSSADSLGVAIPKRKVPAPPLQETPPSPPAQKLPAENGKGKPTFDDLMRGVAADDDEFLSVAHPAPAVAQYSAAEALPPGPARAKPSKEYDVTVAPEKATVGYQIMLFHLRTVEKQLSLMKSLGIEAGVLAIIALLLGYAMTDYSHDGVYKEPYDRISPIPNETVLPQLHMFIVISIGMAAGVAGVAVFGREREQYFRDSQAGLSKVGYFIGTATSSVYCILLASLVFVGIVMVLSSMVPPFGIVFIGIFLIYWVCYGVAACVSVTTPATIAPLLASMICNVLSLANGFVDFPTFIKKASPTFHLSQFMQQYHVDAISHWTDNAWGIAGYSNDQVVLSIFIVLLWGLALHVLAFFLMIFTHRAQQR